MTLPRWIVGGTERFASDAKGTVAVWFGLSLVTLLVCAGGGLDLARSVNQKVMIQGAVDAAALAGASAYTAADQQSAAVAVAKNYMDNFKATSGISSLNAVFAPGSNTSGSSVALYTMKVSATSTITNTLMKMYKGSNEVDVTATAENPVYNITLNMSGFSSSAIDSNSVYYYTVPADGSTPASAKLLYSNTGSAPSSGSLTIQTTASQKIGFLLVNVTDGNAKTTCYRTNQGTQCSSSDYGSNAYGGASQSVHYFFSHMYPPSKVAYPGVTQNCSVQVTTTSSAKPVTGCSTSLPSYATVNCVQASGKTLHYWWNDMGGTTDDKDFNDAAYTVTCSQVSSSTSQGLNLTN